MDKELEDKPTRKTCPLTNDYCMKMDCGFWVQLRDFGACSVQVIGTCYGLDKFEILRRD
jgi:hypothetical protein